MTLNWSAAFVGIPFRDLGRERDGCDCYGLMRLVYREVLSIDLPSHVGVYMSASERSEVAALIARESETPSWHKVEEPATYDVLVFRAGRLGSHVGLHVAPALMLHVSEGHQSRIENYGSPRWAALLAGTYRHQAMISR